MTSTTDKISTLLNSIAAVLIFLSIQHWVDSVFAPYALYMIIGGIILLFTAEIFVRKIPFGFVTTSFILIISHISIFIGLQSYLNLNMDEFWIIYLVAGVLLLNNHRMIANRLTGQ